MRPAALRLFSVFRSNKALAAILVTVVTLVLIGGVLVVTTSLGCGPANLLGLKVSHCTDMSPTAKRGSTTPSPTSDVPAKGSQPTSVPASSYPPNTNPVSSNPPYTNPSSGYPPQSIPGSGTDPFYPPSSSGGPPARSLNCSLPIYAGPPGSGGFIKLPKGNFVADPRSAVALPSPSAGSPSPAPNYTSSGYGPGPGYGPGGYGGYGYGMAWDNKHTRWLPVKPEMVAPDGNHYAYPSTNSIYLVDAAAKTQTELGAGHAWIVLRVLNDKVYATVPNAPGLWIVPFSGNPTQVTDKGYWSAASATAAFGMETSAVPQGATTKLVKLDIASGTVSDWFTRDGTSSWVLGFNLEGNPLIYSNNNNGGGWAIWLTKSATSAVLVANSYTPFGTGGAPVADANGVWFPAYYNQPYGGSNGPGFVLWVPGSGLYWMASVGGQLAGGCV